jgi:hypothetical protein
MKAQYSSLLNDRVAAKRAAILFDSIAVEFTKRAGASWLGKISVEHIDRLSVKEIRTLEIQAGLIAPGIWGAGSTLQIKLETCLGWQEKCGIGFVEITFDGLRGSFEDNFLQFFVLSEFTLNPEDWEIESNSDEWWFARTPQNECYDAQIVEQAINTCV